MPFVSQKKQYIFSAILLSIGLLGYAFSGSHRASPDPTLRIGTEQFSIEIVDTPALRELGLGSREKLDSRWGMLFRFPEIGRDRYAFWMKGMRFPLDIAWIDEGRVVFIERNIPADSGNIFRPPVVADSVLEVNALALSDVAIGDTVEITE